MLVRVVERRIDLILVATQTLVPCEPSSLSTLAMHLLLLFQTVRRFLAMCTLTGLAGLVILVKTVRLRIN